MKGTTLTELNEFYIRKLDVEDKADDMKTAFRMALFLDKSAWKIEIDPHVICRSDGSVFEVEMDKESAERLANQLNELTGNSSQREASNAGS
ncbi:MULTISPECIES: hypothetical protein [Providencia]|uniref:hypothetical protein n=1 Tax=Providencia TaxID=586 RepID=UPI0029903428|nr:MULTISPECIES: hypothetical protein [unclassified Providencia]